MKPGSFQRHSISIDQSIKSDCLPIIYLMMELYISATEGFQIYIRAC